MRWLLAALCVVSSGLAGSATVVAQCTPNPCAPGTCRVEGGGYVCSCPVGYRTDPTRCVLVDACAAGVDDCVVLARCEDAPGASATYTCPCPAGYGGDGRESGSRCTNVNECASDP